MPVMGVSRVLVWAEVDTGSRSGVRHGGSGSYGWRAIRMVVPPGTKCHRC